MNTRILRQKPLAPDEVLGRVEPNGHVYESRFGPDHYVGRVELDTGKIFSARLGPDKYIGHVDLASGKLYRHKPLAADDYLGRVDGDGKFYRHKPLAPDEYAGKIETMVGFALAGAGFLLLVLAALDEEAEGQKQKNEGEEGKPSK
jgi:hypothetical protein